MLKYSASTVEDYIEGNDIEDFDIDELENDRSFMLDVIKKTKDKNFYNLCSDDLKHDYEFVSVLNLLLVLLMSLLVILDLKV